VKFTPLLVFTLESEGGDKPHPYEVCLIYSEGGDKPHPYMYPFFYQWSVCFFKILSNLGQVKYWPVKIVDS
jgi:hypothetical protein